MQATQYGTSTHSTHNQIKLVNSKLQPPSEGNRLVTRKKLIKKLLDQQDTPLITLQAPPGYGKSSLMAQYYQALAKKNYAVAWLTLDSMDCNLERFSAHFKAIIDLAGHNQTPSGQLIRSGETTLTQSHETLLNLLQQQESRPLYLFLDDVHLLESSDSVRVLAMLIESATPDIHFIMSFRGDPNLSFARQRIRGQIFDLSLADLRLSQNEIATLLKHFGVENLSEEELSNLDEHFEGWVGGLKLASMLLKRAPDQVHEMLRSSGEKRQFTEFFLDDVFARLPEEIQSFLVTTAALECFCVPLCDNIRNASDSLDLIDECEARGLFLVSLDEERRWYRYHSLFAQFLKRQLSQRSPEEFNRINATASDWFNANGMQREAFSHALAAGDETRAVEIMAADCDNIFSFEENASELVEKLPLELISRHPSIMLALIWNKLMTWQFETSASMLKLTRSRIDELELAEEMSFELLQDLRHRIQHRELMLNMLADEMVRVESLASELIEEYENAHPLLRGSLFSALLYSRREQFKLDEIERLNTQAMEYLNRYGSELSLVYHHAIVGPSRFIAGRTHQAIQSMTEALKVAERISGKGSSFAAVVALPLARFHYERDEIKQARKLLELYLPHVNNKGFVDQAIAGWLTQARIYMTDGNLRSAFRMLDDADIFAQEHGFERLRLFTLAERLKWLLRQGNTDEVIRLGRKNNLRCPPTKVMPYPGVTSRDEARAMAWVRVAQAEDRLIEALNLAKQWNHFFNSVDALRSAVRWQVMITHLQLLSGDSRAALRTLRQAIFKSAPSGFRRVFIDEGPWLANLLREHTQLSSQHSDLGDSFIVELLERIGGIPSPLEENNVETVICGSLNSRELDILKMVTAGLLNREIGDKLGMTEGSVKWYLQQVYDKIGVRRRSMAAERARQLGIIP